MTFEKKKIQKLIEYLKGYDASCLGPEMRAERPIVVVGPKGGKWDFRVYCYGGYIGSFPAVDLPKELLDKFSDCKKGTASLIACEYKNYLSRYYVDGQGHVYTLNKAMREKYKEFMPSELTTKEDENPPYIPGLDGDFQKLRKRNGIWDDILAENKEGSKYWDYAIAATNAKFTNNETADGERKIQTRLVKEYMGKPKAESKYIVTDMEYEVDEHKPDLVVFDGTSFGLVELKYNGKSMSGKSGLSEHYKNCYKSIYVGDSQKIVNECYRRMCVLREYGLISDSWDNDIKKLQLPQNREMARSMLWMGFLFVDGDENYVKQRMGECFKENAEQLEEVDVRYQYMRYDDIKSGTGLDFGEMKHGIL